MKRLFILIFILQGIFYSKIANSSPAISPNWLLTSDFGILNQDDLNTANLLRIHPLPLHTPDEKDYAYWQCFPAKSVSLKCRSWPDDIPNQFMSDADIRIYFEGKYQSYSFRHAVNLKECH